VITLIRRHAPDAAIAFNSSPATTYEAAARWTRPVSSLGYESDDGLDSCDQGVNMRDLWELSRAIWTVNSSGRSGYLPAIWMIVMVMPIANRNHSSVVARPMKNVAVPFKNDARRGRGWVPSAERASRDTLTPEPW
jgi:hypothetical protein